MRWALGTLFFPGTTWLQIAEKAPSVFLAALVDWLPWLLIGLGTEYYGLTHWGGTLPGIAALQAYSPEQALRYVGVYAGSFVLVLLVGSLWLKSVAESFGTRVTFAQTLLMLGYGTIPISLSRIPDAFPLLPTWACWGAGMVVVARGLYHGVALLLKPEQTKGFGIYMFSVVMVGCLSGIAHLLCLITLQGKL